MGVLKTAAIISLPILGLCATILYFLQKKEEDDLQDTLDDIKTSRVKVIEMKIPKSVIGVVIGRGGSNIKDVQQKTDTRINFKDREDDEEYRTCLIRGTAEAAQLAETMLHEIVTSQPIIEVHETWVPQRAVGRIIGRGGENIRAISTASNAKVNVDSVASRGGNTDNSKETRVVLKGTTEQIAVALSLIQEKVEEDSEVRRKMEFCQANRSPRNEPKPGSPSVISPQKEHKSTVSESLVATGSDGILQVFVSAVESPACFWVQVFSTNAVDLDHLVDEMTEYYSKEENRALHELKQLEIGQIVAAPYTKDSKWYRAEVKELKVDDNESEIDLYYVDYGDSDYIDRSKVLQLRTDFLKLRFQAIECTLANVKPIEGDVWSEKAIDVFEDLCHVAQWKPLRAKVISCDAKPRGRREGSPVPRVNLYDTAGPDDINISDELIRLGFAVKEDGTHNGSVHTPVLQSTTSPEPSSDADSSILDST